MNTKQKLHQLKLQQWADICKQQMSSGLSVKDWCLENNISIHTYYYWKHLLKQEYLDSVRKPSIMSTMNQFLSIDRILRKKIYSIQMPEAIILDLDSTLLDAYGKQEGRAFNFQVSRGCLALTNKNS